MDAAEFQDWLSGIARLSQVQVGQAFQALALFESAKTCDDGAAGFSGEAFAGTAAMPDAPVLPSSKQVPPDDLAGLAHRRVPYRTPHVFVHQHELARQTARQPPGHRPKSSLRAKRAYSAEVAIGYEGGSNPDSQ